MKLIIKKLLFICISILSTYNSKAQLDTLLIQAMDSMAIKLLEPSVPHKHEIANDLIKHISGFAKEYDFLKLEEPPFRVIHYLISPDSSFCIWSGMIRESRDKNAYFCGIWHIKEKKWYELHHVPSNLNYFESETSGMDDWYGAVYYGIYPFNLNDRVMYVVFGFRNEDFITNSKLADILFFEEGEIKFGFPVFVNLPVNKTVNRFMLSYAAEAPIKLNFDPLENKIVFDHLIPMKHLYVKDRIVMVQDGSYNAYEYDEKRGKWLFIDKMEIVPADSAPRDQPVLDSRKNMDIFGRPTKNNDGNRKPSN